LIYGTARATPDEHTPIRTKSLRLLNSPFPVNHCVSDGVIIETTGLADPAPVVQTFFVDEDISELYSLDSVITVVDAHEILDRLAEEKP
jgi:G3E family GTPase